MIRKELEADHAPCNAFDPELLDGLTELAFPETSTTSWRLRIQVIKRVRLTALVQVVQGPSLKRLHRVCHWISVAEPRIQRQKHQGRSDIADVRIGEQLEMNVVLRF
jgi:hypothetical protein